MTSAGQVQIADRNYPFQLLPPPVTSRGRHALLVFLHGAGERGDDNQRQFAWLPPSLRDDERRPCFVLAPQCPVDQRWVEVPWDAPDDTALPAAMAPPLQAVLAALDHVLAGAPVDPDRVLLTGLSMGGFATWDLLARCPERFAGALPVCGGGDAAQAHRMLGVPVWAWHGADDQLVWPVRTRRMVQAIRALGGVVQHSEPAGVGHDSWRQAYGPDGGLAWLLQQDRRSQGRDVVRPPLVPWPDCWLPGAGEFAAGPASAVPADGELAAAGAALRAELAAMPGTPATGTGAVELRVDPALDGEFALRIGATAQVIGRDAAAAARGAGAMALLLRASDGRSPAFTATWDPGLPFRGVLVDCARQPIPVATLRQVVRLCWLLGLSHLVLHLTDDEAFTFPSRARPELPTPGRAYRWDDLRALDDYARARGVTLVPELDVPGHGRAWVGADPRRYGLGDAAANPSLLHPARDAVLADLDALLAELGEVFRGGWVHLGGDEVAPAGIAEDAECRAAMTAHGLGSPAELIGWFLGRAVALAEARGRRVLLWEGFRPEAAVHVPRTATVCAWDGSVFPPERLLAAGYAVVNASFEPLYVVGGDTPRSWDTAALWQWHPRRFRHWQAGHPLRQGLELPAATPVAGALFCAWEITAAELLPALRARLPAFAQRAVAAPGLDPMFGFLARLGAVAPVLAR